MVCRELTKTHEEVKRGSLAELAQWAADGVLGELTVVLAGAQPKADLATLIAEVTDLVDDGMRVKDACVKWWRPIPALHHGVSSTMRFYVRVTDGVVRGGQ